MSAADLRECRVAAVLRRCEEIRATTWSEDPAAGGYISTDEVWALLTDPAPEPIDPSEPVAPEACTHPGAYVYAHAGTREGYGEPLHWRAAETEEGDARRPGEQLGAGLGRCGACGCLVAQLTTWHPEDDPAGGRSFGTRWVGLYETGGDRDLPVDAVDSSKPLREFHGDADPGDLTDDGLERIVRVRGRHPDGRDLTVPYAVGDTDRDTERNLVAELHRYGLRVRTVGRLDGGGYQVRLTGT